jgi:hypothetical protein
MLSNIVNQPKSWFTNIKELAESPNNLNIYIPENTLTYDLLIEHSKSDSEDSIYFKQLLDRVKATTYFEIHNFEKLKSLCYGENALIFNSMKGELIFEYRSECDLSINDLKYDQMNVIRLIRKDYQYSDQMIHM